MLFSFERLSPSRAAAISVSMCHFQLNPRCADDRRHFKDVNIGTLLFLCFVWCVTECARSCVSNKLGIVCIVKQWQLSSRNSVLDTQLWFSFHYNFCCKSFSSLLMRAAMQAEHHIKLPSFLFHLPQNLFMLIAVKDLEFVENMLSGSHADGEGYTTSKCINQWNITRLMISWCMYHKRTGLIIQI